MTGRCPGRPVRIAHPGGWNNPHYQMLLMAKVNRGLKVTTGFNNLRVTGDPEKSRFSEIVETNPERVDSRDKVGVGRNGKWQVETKHLIVLL